jgi:large conductance mechanosensitive channel
MFKEFREFAIRGSVVDMAVGIVIGTAFGAIARSLVNDVIMPPIGLLLANADFSDLYLLLKAGSPPPPYDSVAAAQAAGAVTMNVGLFINSLIGFIVIAWAVFLLVRTINRLRRREEKPPAAPTTKDCPYCRITIPLTASRCPHCTSQLEH